MDVDYCVILSRKKEQNNIDIKKVIVLAVLALISMATFAQGFSKQEQELIDLSNLKWTWMAEKNADKLAELFHDNAMFVHMGGSWEKEQEVNIIRSGMIWYKKADIHSQQVKFVEDNAIVYSNIHMTSEVGGNKVRFPFTVSEVYVKKDGQWKLGALIFTMLMEQTGDDNEKNSNNRLAADAYDFRHRNSERTKTREQHETATETDREVGQGLLT